MIEGMSLRRCVRQHCFDGLIFAGIRMMGGRFQDAIPGLFGVLFGASYSTATRMARPSTKVLRTT